MYLVLNTSDKDNMIYFIISQAVFAVIIALETLLYNLFGSKNKIISFSLFGFLIVSIGVMALMHGFTRGQYDLNKKQVFVIDVFACVVYVGVLLLGDIFIKNLIKFH